MAEYKYAFNNCKGSSESWTKNKDLNVELVERIGFVPLEKRIQNITNASELLRAYRDGIYGDDDLECDEYGSIIGDDKREDSFDDVDPTMDSEFTRVESFQIDEYLKSKKNVKKEKKVAQNQSVSVSEPKKEVTQNERSNESNS